MSWIPYLSMTALTVVGTMLILIILLQRGRGGGLAGSLGGMGGQSALGTKAGDVFTRITIVLAVFWVILAATNVYALRLNGPMYAGGTNVVPTASALGESTSDADGMESLDLPESTTTSSDAKPAGEGTSQPAADTPAEGESQPTPAEAPEGATPAKPATEEQKPESKPETPAEPESPASKPEEAAKPEGEAAKPASPAASESQPE